MINKGTKCVCGCGRTVKPGVNPGNQRRYYGTECYPSNRARAEKRDKLKQCACVCGRSFPAGGKGFQRRKYYEESCRGAKKLPKIYKASGKEKTFRSWLCRGFNEDSSGISYGLCDCHSACSDDPDTPWEYEKNGGRRCYKFTDNNYIPYTSSLAGVAVNRGEGRR